MTAVTVIGLGPMGRAVAHALLRAGRQVTVWNRTPGKADTLVAEGAHLARSPGEALGSAPVAVFCVIDDDAVASVVEQAADNVELGGLTLVNLTADSPARTRALAQELDERGVTLIDGAIMTPAAAIGSDATRILVAGPRQAYEAHRDVFTAFGGTCHFVDDDVGAASTYDVALLSLFWTSIAGVAQALALTRAEGVDAEEFTPHAVAMTQLVVDLLPGLAADFEAGRYSGDDSATIDSVSASLDHLRDAFIRSDVSTHVLDAIAALVGDALRAGHGHDAPIRLADTLTHPEHGVGESPA